MPRIDTANLVSLSAASRRGISKLANDAANGHERILLRNDTPVAAIVGIDRLNELDQLRKLEEDMLDIVLATTRMVDDSGQRHDLDEVLIRFGVSRAALSEAGEQMPVLVELVEPAFEDLVRRPNGDDIKLFLAKLLLIQMQGESAGQPLGTGLSDWQRIAVGDRDWRIVYRMNAAGTVATIWALGDRTDAECYVEAARCIRALGKSNPTAISLAAVLVRLTERRRTQRL